MSHGWNKELSVTTGGKKYDMRNYKKIVPLRNLFFPTSVHINDLKIIFWTIFQKWVL